MRCVPRPDHDRLLFPSTCVSPLPARQFEDGFAWACYDLKGLCPAAVPVALTQLARGTLLSLPAVPPITSLTRPFLDRACRRSDEERLPADAVLEEKIH